MSRKIEDLTPEAQEKHGLFKSAMDEAGIPFMVTCTMRTQAEQDALYEQGRTKPGPVVTWTRHSRHTPRIGDNGKSRAFDIAILKDGKPCWDAKVSVDGDRVPDYQEAGEIGERVGLRWGGRWKPADLCHFETMEV